MLPLAENLFEVLAFADVARDPDQSDDFARLIPASRLDGLQKHCLAIEHNFIFKGDRAAGRQHGTVLLNDAAGVVGGEEREVIEADDLFFGPSEKTRRRCVDDAVSPFKVLHVSEVSDVVEQGGEQGFVARRDRRHGRPWLYSRIRNNVRRGAQAHGSSGEFRETDTKQCFVRMRNPWPVRPRL